MALNHNQSTPDQSQFYSDPILDPTIFASFVLNWFDTNGRHNLPWQHDLHPYRVWISEIMLQQTQVATVIPYFLRFTERFPTVYALDEADIDQVLHLWTGLGYYARARNLHSTAQTIVKDHGGAFPHSLDKLEALPGIGKSTAGAIAALSMNIRAPILDGNVKRVLTRAFAIEGWPEQTRIKNQLWEIAEELTPQERVADYTQAIMDLGATVCTRSRPACNLCPLSADCKAFNQDRVANFPGRKPTKTLPVKSVAMFILQNESGDVLLEKRPPQGIWGSLYSLPESPSGATPPTFNTVEVSIEGSLELDSIRHTFSHYHLDIQPIKLRSQCLIAGVAEKDRWLWYPLDNSMEVGMAAPVKKLLSRLASSQQSRGTRMSRMVHCKKYDKELPGLAVPPYPGPKGQEIYESVSKQAWTEWQTQQTMLINEKQLSLMNPDARKYLQQEMEKFFNNEEYDIAEGYVPPAE